MIEWSLSLFYLFLCFLGIRYLPFFKHVLSTRLLIVLFLLKVFAGIGLYIIYTHFYPDRCNADIFKYFDDSSIMFAALYDKPWDYIKMMTGIANDNDYFNHMYYYKMNNWFRLFDSSALNDNHIIIRLNAFFHLFSFGYYQVHNVFMNFISFTGLVALYKGFFKLFPDKKYSLMFVVFLIPSVLFWTSGVLKEGLLVFGLGFLIYSLLNLLHEPFRSKHLIMLGFSVLVLFQVKVYIIAILFPLLIIYGWVSKKPSYIFYKYGLSLLFGLALITVLALIYPAYDIIEIVNIKQLSFINVAKVMNSGSFIAPPVINDNPLTWITGMMHGFFNVFVMPIGYFKTNFLMLFSAVENALILCISAWACFKIKPLAFREMNFLVLSVLFVFLSYSLIGIITPVMGAIVRYRIPAIPFWGLACIAFMHTHPFENKVNQYMKYLRLD